MLKEKFGKAKVLKYYENDCRQNKFVLCGIKNENISNKELAEELYKPIIRKSKKREVHSSFIDNIWSADITDMQLISKFNKVFRFLLCLIYIFRKYTWFIPLKDKKGITITNALSMNLIAN